MRGAAAVLVAVHRTLRIKAVFRAVFRAASNQPNNAPEPIGAAHHPRRYRATIYAVIVMTLASAPTAAWEADVHYVLTFWLTLQAGYSRLHADLIAQGNQSYDDSAHHAAIPTVIGITVTGDEGSARDLQQKHFPNDGLFPSPPARRLVTPNGPVARWRVEGATRPNPASTALLELGEALHPFHDSWSHQGVPDIPFGLRPNLVSAHPAARGGWMSHDADKTHLHVKETMEVAEETYKLLLQFRANNPTYGQRPAEPWTKVAPIVAEFAQAADKSQKDAWAVKYTSMTRAAATKFSTPLSLMGLPAREPTQPWAVRALFTMPTRTTVPPDLVRTAQNFLDTWITQMNVAAAVAFIDLTGLPAMEPLRGTQDMGRWASKILAMYLAADHGAVNDAGHGDPRHPRYGALPEAAQSDGPFRSIIAKAPLISPADFLPAEAQSGVALTIQFANQPNDAIALVWRQLVGQWRITMLVPAVS